MPIPPRLRAAGRAIVLAGALVATFLVFGVVAMRMALKSRDVTVPSLTGMTVADASRLLSSRGLTLKVDPSRRTDATVPAGQIVEQTPEKGTTTRLDRSVRVWVSAGAHLNIIPDLVGQTEDSARARITQDGLTLTRESTIRSETYPARMVVAQVPPPRTSGSSVELLVNGAHEEITYLMPDLIGLDGTQVRTYLRARGFRVAIVGQQAYPGVTPGIVLRQNPQAGFQISPGQAISLEVSQ